MNGREGFVLYKSFYRPVQHLSLEQKGKLFDAIYHYQLDGSVEVDDDIRVAFEFFRGQFERDDEKYEQKAGRLRENGRKGGTEKARRHEADARSEDDTSSRPSKCLDNVANLANATNTTDNVANVAYKDKDISIGLYKEKDKKESAQSCDCTHSQESSCISLSPAVEEKEKVPLKRKIFVPPTVEEVRSYCKEKGYGISPERFINYYTSIGWVVGKAEKKMKDWKSTVRNWEIDRKREEDERNRKQQQNQRGDAGSARWVDPKAGGDWSSDNITGVGK